MEETVKKLKNTFWSVIVVTILMIALYETELIHSYIYDEQTEYIATSLMEIATVALLPLALYLFKIKTVREQLVKGQWQALNRWAMIRLAMIGMPMIVNFWLYYWCHNAAFFYLAIICAICLIFIYPSKNRCEDEINPEA